MHFPRALTLPPGPLNTLSTPPYTQYAPQAAVLLSHRTDSAPEIHNLTNAQQALSCEAGNLSTRLCRHLSTCLCSYSTIQAADSKRRDTSPISSSSSTLIFVLHSPQHSLTTRCL